MLFCGQTSLYGEGTYLCMEPSVALGFSPWGTTGWSQCQLAESLSIVALCEVIDDPSVKHTSGKSPLFKYTYISKAFMVSRYNLSSFGTNDIDTGLSWQHEYRTNKMAKL